jgi:PAS domain S-box-containing protein
MDMVQRLLLVEDNPGDADLIREMLEGAGPAGFSIETVPRLSDAVSRLKSNAIDLVLLDLGLPDSSGLETFLKLKAAVPDVPTIILTGNVDQETAVTAVKAGAQDFLVKGRLSGDLVMRSILYALERTRIERSLFVSERKFRRLYESMIDAYVQVDMTGRIVECNKAYTDLLGYTKEELLQLSYIDITPERWRAAEADIVKKQVLPRGYSDLYEKEYQRKDGTLVSIELRTSLLKNEAGQPTGLWAIVRNISERKRSEAERELLRAAIEQVGETILITDTRGIIQYVNPALTRITGYSKEEVIGQNPRIFNSGRQDRAFYQHLWETIAGGDTFQGRMINRRKDGSFFTEEATISPVCDAAGTIVNYVAVKRDITEKLQLENHLLHAQKLEAIGTLAGGIAHDFNNILSAILGYTDLVREEIGEQSQAGKDLQQVIMASQRAIDLVKQILTISRQGEQKKQPVKIQYIIKEALKLLRPSISTLINITSTIDLECPEILADPTEIHQIIMNFCTNAYHAMREMQRENHIMTLRLEPVVLDSTAVLKLGLNISAGRFVKLVVSDTGCGMDAATMARIFDPYFTTKEKGQGTGLGLATVHSIVADCGGAVTVASEIGQGTTFSVYLPVFEGDIPAKKEQKENKIVALGTERIMVIDDEGLIVQLLQRMLKKYGYRVSTFTSAEDALRIFIDEPTAYDLVITDMNMPKVLGTDLARAFLETRPEIPIILCTGFSEKVDLEQARLIGIRGFMYKPMEQNVLLNLVRNILDNNQS